MDKNLINSSRRFFGFCPSTAGLYIISNNHSLYTQIVVQGIRSKGPLRTGSKLNMMFGILYKISLLEINQRPPPEFGFL